MAEDVFVGGEEALFGADDEGDDRGCEGAVERKSQKNDINKSR